MMHTQKYFKVNTNRHMVALSLEEAEFVRAVMHAMLPTSANEGTFLPQAHLMFLSLLSIASLFGVFSTILIHTNTCFQSHPHTKLQPNLFEKLPPSQHPRCSVIPISHLAFASTVVCCSTQQETIPRHLHNNFLPQLNAIASSTVSYTIIGTCFVE